MTNKQIKALPGRAYELSFSKPSDIVIPDPDEGKTAPERFAGQIIAKVKCEPRMFWNSKRKGTRQRGET